LLLLPIIYGGQSSRDMQASSKSKPQHTCLYWQSRVDPGIRFPEGERIPDTRDEQQRLKGIECLLELEGNENPSSIKGATNPRTSQTFGGTPVDVAALYYASYSYYEKWNHAQAAVLVDERPKEDQKCRVRRAYDAYRKWYGEVKKIGLNKAREARLDPLDGSGIRWY
jgi:hypothetical protein